MVSGNALGRALIVALLALAGVAQGLAYAPYPSMYASPYPLERTSPYYPSSYLSPPRTGLASYSYAYPGQYRNTFGAFDRYRQYTFAAYRNPALAYAYPRSAY